MFCKQCGGYLQPVNRFCMRCGCQNISAVITHPPKVKRNKKTLFAWQQLIVVDSPSRLVFNEKSSTEHTQPIVHRDFEIVTDCQNLIQTTANPNVFFARLDLLYERLAHLIQLEPYYRFQPQLPSDILLQSCQRENASVKAFLERYFYKTSEKANGLKTEKAKLNQFEKYKETLDSFSNRISKDNYEYALTLYRSAKEVLGKGQLSSVIPKPKIPVTCKNYDISSIQGIRQIPYNDFSVMRELQKCATKHKKNDDLPLAIECLRKSNQISDYQSDYSEKLTEKEYLRVLKYIKLLKNDGFYQQEENAIRQRHPKFLDKRISNRERIQAELVYCKESETDLVTVDADSSCKICKQFRNIVFSISGRNWRYPKLPDIIIYQTHECTEHFMTIFPYFEDIPD